MGAISKALEGQTADICTFAKLFKLVDKEDQASIGNAIERGVSGYVIANAMRDGGHQISASTISKHIQGRCKCFPVKKENK